jgi:membrane associated rhomboid family serine protease
MPDRQSPGDDERSSLDKYLEWVRHSLIYDEDFAPADWYFSTDISVHCWGLLSKPMHGTDYLVGFVPLSPDLDARAILSAMTGELFKRYAGSRTRAHLTLVAVMQDEPDERLSGLLARSEQSANVVDIVAVDTARGKIVWSEEYRRNQPGAKSIGFPGPEQRPLTVLPGRSGMREERTREEHTPEEARRARRWFRQRARRSLFERGQQGSSAPTVANAFIAINVLMLVIEELAGGSSSTRTLIRLGAKFTPYIQAGQWWRVFTYQFLHIGVVHLLFNSYALFNIGPLIEDTFGHAGFAAIYLLSGTLGGLASAVFSPVSVSAGASGAIFGLLGATALFLLSGNVSWDVIWRTVGYPVVATTVYGLLIRIDHFGHFGGLIGGFLVAAAIGLGYRIRPASRIAAAIGYVALFIALFAVLML